MLDSSFNGHRPSSHLDVCVLDPGICERFKAESSNPSVLLQGEYLMEVENVRWDYKDNFLEWKLKGVDDASLGNSETARNYAKGGSMKFLSMNLRAVGIDSDDFHVVISQLPKAVGKKIFVKIVETERADSVFPYRNPYFNAVSGALSQSQEENLEVQ